MRKPQPLLPLLRSRAQGELLALIYLHPGRDYSITEAAAAISAPVKSVHTEAARLVEAGFLADSRRGNTRLLRVPADSPLTAPLTDLLALTYGPLTVLTELLSEAEDVREAYIYGSWAARYSGEPGPVPDDVDVLVVGDASRDDLYDIARAAGRRLGREVNIRRVMPGTWASPPPGDPFLKHVKERPLVELGVGT